MAFCMDETMDQNLVESDDNFGIFEQVAPGLCSKNNFSVLNSRVGMDNQTEWRNGHRKKRRRNDTGSVDLDTFTSMSNEEKMIALFTKITNIEQSQNACTNKLTDIIGVAHEKVTKLEAASSKHNEQLKILTYRSIDLEARNRRNNLVFHGLADVVNENSKELLIQFLENELGIDTSTIHIDRVHRLGQPIIVRQGARLTRRPLIVAFRNYPDTELILDKARALRGTIFRVERDLPIEIKNARKELWPMYKNYRQNRQNRVKIVYPAKLIVNSRVVADKFPEWSRYIKKNRLEQLGLDTEQNGHEFLDSINKNEPVKQNTNKTNNIMQMCDKNQQNKNETSELQHTMNHVFTTNTIHSIASKQTCERIQPRDKVPSNDNGEPCCQSDSDLSCSQSIIQPTKPNQQSKSNRKKATLSKTVPKRTSNARSRKNPSVKSTSKIKPVVNPRPARCNNTQRQQVGAATNLPVQTADTSPRGNENQNNITPGTTDNGRL